MKTFDIIIVGAGINGCSLAYALKEKGKEVLVLEQEGIASGGSGAAGAFINPKISKSGPLKELIEKAYLYALVYYDKNFKDLTTLAPLLHISKFTDENEKIEHFKNNTLLKIGGIPSELKPHLKTYTDKFSSVYINESAVIEAKKVCKAMLEDVEYDKLKVENPSYEDGLWHIGEYKAKRLILCTGAYEEVFKEPYIKLRRIYGQRCEVESSTVLKTSIHHEVSVSATKKNGRIVIGASHYLEKADMPSKEKGEAELVELAQKSVSLENVRIIDSFSGMRSGSNDYLPILGKMPKGIKSFEQYPLGQKAKQTSELEYHPNVYMMNGAGGYGFVLAPYLANLLQEHLLEGTELPKSLSPERFFYRWAKKEALK